VPDKLAKTTLDPPAKPQASSSPDKIVKTKLEVPGGTKAPTTDGELPSSDTANETRPPISRSSQTRNPTRWLLVGGGVIAVFAMMSMCGIGIGLYWYSKQRQTASDEGVPVTRKPNQLSPEEFAERARIVHFNKVATPKRLYGIEMVQIKGKFKPTESGNDTAFVITWESLKRLRQDEISENEGSSDVMLIRNRGFSVKKGIPVDLKKERLSFYQNFSYALIVSNLIPLTEKEFVVAAGPDETIRKHECTSIVVNRAGRQPINLYFSKETKELKKADFKGTFVDADDKLLPNAHIEFFFEDYKTVDGVNHWHKHEQWRDGKKYATVEIAEIKFFDTVDESPFKFNSKVIQLRVDDLLRGYKVQDIDLLIQGQDPGASRFSRLVKGFNNNKQKPDMQVQFRAALIEYPDLMSNQKVANLEKGDVEALAAILSSGEPAELQQFAGEEALRLDPLQLEVNQLMALVEQSEKEANKKLAKVYLLQKLATPVVKDLPAIRKGLKNPDRDLVLACIDAVGALGTKGGDAEPDLIPLLKSEKRMSDRAADALFKMKRLIDVVDKNDDRKVLLAGLGYLKSERVNTPNALKVYENRLDHADSEVKNLAAVALFTLGPDRMPLNERLLELANRSDPEARASARKHLRDKLVKVTPTDLPTLREGLKKSDSELLPHFIKAVGKADASKAVPELTALLKAGKETDSVCSVLHDAGKLVEVVDKDADASVVLAGLSYLKKQEAKGDDARRLYRKRVGHSDVNVKTLAALALLQLGRQDIDLELALDFVDSTKWSKDVLAAAEELANQKLKSESTETVRRLLSHANLNTKDKAAMELLKQRPADLNLNDVLDFVDPKKWKTEETRVAAVKLLDDKLKSVDKKKLLELRESEIETVSNSAAWALLGVKDLTLSELLALADPMRWADEKGHEKSVKLFEEKVQNTKKEDLGILTANLERNKREKVRLAIIQGIGKLKGENYEAAPDLAKLLLSSESNEVSINASGVLKAMGKKGSKAVPSLAKTVSEHKDKSVAVAAAQALCKIDRDHELFWPKGKGIDVLVFDLAPDFQFDPKTFDFEQHVKARIDAQIKDGSAAALLEIGEPAIRVVYRQLLFDYNILHVDKKKENRNVPPTAMRYVGFRMIEEFAKKANEPRSIKTLKGLRNDLGIMWTGNKSNNFDGETELSANATKAFKLGYIPEQVKNLHNATSIAAKGACEGIDRLKAGQ
jgi:hypothetical protein